MAENKGHDQDANAGVDDADQGEPIGSGTGAGGSGDVSGSAAGGASEDDFPPDDASKNGEGAGAERST